MAEIIMRETSERTLEFTGEAIVRCKYCVFAILDGNNRKRCAFFNAPVSPYDFCSKGKPHG